MRHDGYFLGFFGASPVTRQVSVESALNKVATTGFNFSALRSVAIILDHVVGRLENYGLLGAPRTGADVGI